MNRQVYSQVELADPPDRTGKTVLIVDDDTVFRTSLSDGLLFMLDDITVYTAENGEQALAVIRTTPVDLVITDLRMPFVDGWGVMLGMDEFRPATPVIVMSAYADIDKVIDLETRGIHYFEKPLDLDRLARTVRSLLS
jgi:DNA-binding NtrC family response regulator